MIAREISWLNEARAEVLHETSLFSFPPSGSLVCGGFLYLQKTASKDQKVYDCVLECRVRKPWGYHSSATRPQLPAIAIEGSPNMATNGETNGAAVNEPHKSFDTILVLDFGYAPATTFGEYRLMEAGRSTRT
jgi:hypothetical protein